MNISKKHFSIIQALSDGINLYFKNLQLLLPVIIPVGFIIYLSLWFIGINFQLPAKIGMIKVHTPPIAAASYNFYLKTSILGLILVSIYKAFIINFGLKIYDHPYRKSLTLTDFFSLDFDMASYIFARLRYIATSAVGLCLFIIPGLIWIPRYYFAYYIIIDQKIPIRTSFAESSVLSYGTKCKIWLFILINYSITIMLITSTISIISLNLSNILDTHLYICRNISL